MKTKAQLEARITELTRQVDKLYAENVALKRTLEGIGEDMDNGVIVSAGDITTEDYRKTVIGPQGLTVSLEPSTVPPMSKITYAQHYGGQTRVSLEGRWIGYIKQEDGGWRYYPKGWTTGGDIYPTLAACKASLEAE